MLVRRERVSVFVELSAALYLGVLAVIAGLGWTFRAHFKNLGDPLVLTTLSVLFAGSVYYCLQHAPAYSEEETDSADFALDYVLYLGCLALSAELAYLAFRFELFRRYSDDGLLGTATVFALLAYRFDNRFVLSLALASLAGWFGFKMPALGFASPGTLRLTAVSYGVVVGATGAALYLKRIKPHFLETYLHVAANAVLVGVLSGVRDPSTGPFYLAALAALSVSGVRFRRFAYVAYGVVYGYAGITSRVLAHVTGLTEFLAYFVVTGTLVVIALVVIARRFGRDA